jgi:multicomponent Na+:H+ antiporter subunit D
VVTQLQLLLFAGLAFFVMLSQMERMLTVTLDFDWFYRVLLVRVAVVVERTWQWLVTRLRELRRDLGVVLGPRLGAWFLPSGRLAQTWPTGSMTLWVTVILVLLVVLD